MSLSMPQHCKIFEGAEICELPALKQISDAARFSRSAICQSACQPLDKQQKLSSNCHHQTVSLDNWPNTLGISAQT